MVPGHVAKIGPLLLGYAPIVSMNGRRRGLYGRKVRCTCGWRAQTNEPSDMRVRGMFERHLESAGTGVFGFGPARVL